MLFLVCVRFVMFSAKIELVPYFAGVHGAGGHMSSLSPEGSAEKYGQAPGGDSLTDFVTLVCQETNNSHHQVSVHPQCVSPHTTR